MSQGSPQNPTFRVDALAFEACCPKVICRHCQTVISIPTRRNPRSIHCPGCQTRLKVIHHDKKWSVVAEDLHSGR